MKYLCVCAGGNCRSVTLAFVLKMRRLDALAVGVDPAVGNTGETIRHLCEWADRILITDSTLAPRIPVEFAAKLRDFNVGPDRWVRALAPDLIAIFQQLCDRPGALA